MTEVAGLIVAGLSAAYGAYAGETGAQQQRKARQRSLGAQRQNEAAALSQAKRADQADKAASQQTPDVSALLTDAMKPKTPTLLTGPNGVDPSRLKLGQSTLLGG